MEQQIVDNSITALSFDFLDGVEEKPKFSLGEAKRGIRVPGGTSAAAVSGVEVDTSVAEIGKVGLVASAATDVAATVSSPETSTSTVSQASRASAAAGAQKEAETSGVVVSPLRRHAWGLFYAVRAVLLALVVCCVGTLVLTMIMNPDLTFVGAIQLILERIGETYQRILELFS